MLPSLVQLAKASYTTKPTAATAGRVFKRAQKGLFNGRAKRYGNNVPESHQKTRRSWLPNIQLKSLYSASLDEKLRIKVTSSTLRTIDKVGGLDQYLLRPHFSSLLGDYGEHLRQRILQKRETQLLLKSQGGGGSDMQSEEFGRQLKETLRAHQR